MEGRWKVNLRKKRNNSGWGRKAEGIENDNKEHDWREIWKMKWRILWEIKNEMKGEWKEKWREKKKKKAQSNKRDFKI